MSPARNHLDMGNDDDDDYRRKRRNRKHYKKYDRDDDHDDRWDRNQSKFTTTVIERLFQALDSSVANNMIKLGATGIVCVTTLAAAITFAMTQVPTSDFLIPTMAFGMLTTAAIWLFGKKRRGEKPAVKVDLSQELLTLKSTIKDLEERLQNVEAIESLDRRLARRQADELAKDQLNLTQEQETGSEVAKTGTIRMSVEE